MPESLRVQGQELVASVKKTALGGAPTADWGFQVTISGADGFPDADSIYLRKVNAAGTQHRFGGGHDGMCDPHVIDLLAAPAEGLAEEAQAQFEILSGYVCDGSPRGRRAVVPIVYPGQ